MKIIQWKNWQRVTPLMLDFLQKKLFLELCFLQSRKKNGSNPEKVLKMGQKCFLMYQIQQKVFVWS